MDKIIVTALLIIAGVTAAALVVTTLTPIIGKSSRSVVESQQDVATRIQTDIKVIKAHASDGENARAWVKNIGNANIEFIDLSDLFISSEDGTRFIPLSSGTSTPNYWSTEKAGSWTKGETVEFVLKIDSGDALETGKTYLFSFSTPNGVASEYVFTY